MLQQEEKQAPRLAPIKTEDEGIVGWHVFGEVWGVSEGLLSDEQFLKNVVIKAAEVANMHLVDIKVWRFGGGDRGGVSVIALVLESHIAVHTWPTYNYATIDVYTCGSQSRPWDAFDYIVSQLRPKTYTKSIVDRSSDR